MMPRQRIKQKGGAWGRRKMTSGNQHLSYKKLFSAKNWRSQTLPQQVSGARPNGAPSGSGDVQPTDVDHLCLLLVQPWEAPCAGDLEQPRLPWVQIPTSGLPWVQKSAAGLPQPRWSHGVASPPNVFESRNSGGLWGGEKESQCCLRQVIGSCRFN